MIYAYGQTSPDVFHDAPSSIEANTISSPDFYKADELKFHGGGISCAGVPAGNFDGHGVIGTVNFFSTPSDEPEGCTPSPLEGFDCVTVVENSSPEYRIHYSLLNDGADGGTGRKLRQTTPSKIRMAGEVISGGERRLL